MEVLLCLAIAIAIYIDYLFAKNFYEAARLKGYNDKKYFWLSFGFTAAGYLLIIALPEKTNEEKSNDIDELPTL